MATLRTNPPTDGRAVILFDGNCELCDRSSRHLEQAVGTKRVRRASFQQPHILEAYPGLVRAECMKVMHVILPSGRVVRGAEGIFRTISLLPWIGIIAFVYYLPGIRFICDAAYRVLANHRYRLFMRRKGCTNGVCRFDI